MLAANSKLGALRAGPDLEAERKLRESERHLNGLSATAAT
jgi:hypothetical protein